MPLFSAFVERNRESV